MYFYGTRKRQNINGKYLTYMCSWSTLHPRNEQNNNFTQADFFAEISCVFAINGSWVKESIEQLILRQRLPTNLVLSDTRAKGQNC